METQEQELVKSFTQHYPPGTQEDDNSFSSRNLIIGKGTELEFPEGQGGGKGEPGVPPTFTETLIDAQAIQPNQTCVICYRKFVRLTYKEYKDFLRENTNCEYYQLKENKEELNGLFQALELCYDVRFECVTCSSCVCYGCVPKMKGLMIEDPFMDEYEEFMGKRYPGDPPGLYPGVMGKDGPVTCPICRTKDYREYYTRQTRGNIPENILREIKKGVRL